MSSRIPSGSTVPFTPKPNKKARSSRLTLTDKEFNNIAGTLASVRKVRTDTILEEWDSPEGPDGIRRIGTGDGPSRPTTSGHSHAQVRQVSRASSASSTRRPPSASAPNRPPAASSSTGYRVPSTASSSSRHDERESAAYKRNGKLPDRAPPTLAPPAPVEEIQAMHIREEPEADEGLGLEDQPERQLDGVPLEVQEAWICEDLMFVLQGVEGTLIRYDESYDPLDGDQRLQGARWTIDRSLDPSLLSLVERMLPLATYYTSVEASMDSRNTSEYGMVSHALCSGIRSMLKEYRVLTAQLESLYLSSPTFTLQTLYYHLHPTIHTMSLLASLCQSLETDDVTKDESGETSDDDGFGGMAEELGLGGAALKGIMGAAKGQQGLIPGSDTSAGEVLGGEVLGIICEREATMSGDPTASTLHSTLLQHASQPYCRMLIKWISTGYLSDPFDEFMVKESTHISKSVLESDYTDEYWERRYTLRDGSSLASSSGSNGNSGKAAPSISAGVPSLRDGTNRLPGGACIPAFLQPWKHKILLAGKYLNVIRECGLEVKKPGEVEDVKDSLVLMNEPKFYKRIEDAYIYANKTLLRLMLEEQELIPHLRSMKHFFFLDQSDFLTNFLDLAQSELKKQSKQASIVKLQSLLDLAVRNPASSSSNDPYKDNLKVTMASQGLYEWLLKIVSRTGGGLGDDGGGGGGTGDLDFASSGGVDEDPSVQKTLFAHDAVAFDFSVKFPLSLVISRKTITRYQLIFRFLLHLHHLESGLSTMWLDHKAPNWRDDCGNRDMQRWKSRIFSLRSRMLVFVRQVLAFVTGEVLESNWRILEAKIAKVQTVDQLLRDHVDFLDTCLKQCMLTTSKLLSVYAKLMKTIATFVSYQPKLTVYLDHFLADPDGETEAQRKKRWEVLKTFEINYNHHSELHLDAVTYNAGSENVALLALVTRLHQTTMRFNGK